MNETEQVYEDADVLPPVDLTSMSDARLKAEIRRMTPPGAQVPEVSAEEAPGSALETVVRSASMDAAGNVRMEFRMSPEDRAMARQSSQDLARQHASAIGSPAGVRGLFPSNKVRFVVKRRPAQEPQG